MLRAVGEKSRERSRCGGIASWLWRDDSNFSTHAVQKCKRVLSTLKPNQVLGWFSHEFLIYTVLHAGRIEGCTVGRHNANGDHAGRHFGCAHPRVFRNWRHHRCLEDCWWGWQAQLQQVRTLPLSMVLDCISANKANPRIKQWWWQKFSSQEMFLRISILATP